eukprot:3898744-Alexandrium_andersonii.AAC.1
MCGTCALKRTWRPQLSTALAWGIFRAPKIDARARSALPAFYSREERRLCGCACLRKLWEALASKRAQRRRFAKVLMRDSNA